MAVAHSVISTFFLKLVTVTSQTSCWHSSPGHYAHIHTHTNTSTGNSVVKPVKGRQMLDLPCRTEQKWITTECMCLELHMCSHTYMCQCPQMCVCVLGCRAACTHINILQAMGVILGIFIFAGNAKRQPTSNLALSYFLWNLWKGEGGLERKEGDSKVSGEVKKSLIWCRMERQ